MTSEKETPERTSIGQLKWMGRTFLKVAFIVGAAMLLVRVGSALTDHRHIKVEQYYPDAKALEQALYKAHPVGSPIEFFMEAMYRSGMGLGSDSILDNGIQNNNGVLGPYKFRSANAKQMLGYSDSWDTWFPCIYHMVGIDVEYDQDEKITGIFVSMGGTKCQWM